LTPDISAPGPSGGLKFGGLVAHIGPYLSSKPLTGGFYGGPPTNFESFDKPEVGKTGALILGEPDVAGTRVLFRLDKLEYRKGIGGLERVLYVPISPKIPPKWTKLFLGGIFAKIFLRNGSSYDCHV